MSTLSDDARTCSKCGLLVSLSRNKKRNRVTRDDGGLDHDFCDTREGREARREADLHAAVTHRGAVRQAALVGDSRYGRL